MQVRTVRTGWEPHINVKKAIITAIHARRRALARSLYNLQPCGYFCKEFWPQIRTSQIHNCSMVLCGCWHPEQFGQVWNWNETNLYWSIPANNWKWFILSLPHSLLNTIASEFNIVISYSPSDPNGKQNTPLSGLLATKMACEKHVTRKHGRYGAHTKSSVPVSIRKRMIDLICSRKPYRWCNMMQLRREQMVSQKAMSVWNKQYTHIFP